MGTEKDAINARENKQKIESFLASLRGGASVLKASKAATVDYSTIWRWRQKYKEFNEKVLAILDSRTQIVEDALYLNAASGNLGAQIFWLKNRARDRWKDRHEATVEGDLDITIRYATEKDKKKGR